MYERILVPIDGSAQAARGLSEAMRLARDLGSRIRVMHVLNQRPLAAPGITAARFDALFEQLREDGRLLLTEAERSAHRAGVPVEVRLIEVSEGAPGDCVIEQAQKWPADLIVCGTHGRRGLLRLLMGSDAERILRRSPVPVLLVPTRVCEPIAQAEQAADALR